MIMCMSNIICVTNRKLCHEDFLRRIDRIASCHPAGIILREKDMKHEEYKELAAAVMKICEQYNIEFILHSNFDVAITLQVDAIHMPLHLLKIMTDEQRAHFRVLGASCHSVQEAVEAQHLGCTYITAGHVFETDCKKGLPGRGLEFLRNVRAAVDVPVYGIGGINTDNISSVLDAGADGVCIMSSLMVCEDVTGLMKSMEGQDEIQ